MHSAEKASKLVLYGKKYILKLFSANLKVTGINKCQFTNNASVHHNTLKNASDKYCNITPGGGTKVVSVRNVHFLRGYNSRHYSYCARTRQGRTKNFSFSVMQKGLLGWCRADKVLWTAHFPTVGTENYLQTHGARSALCSFFAPERPQRGMTKMEVWWDLVQAMFPWMVPQNVGPNLNLA